MTLESENKRNLLELAELLMLMGTRLRELEAELHALKAELRAMRETRH